MMKTEERSVYKSWILICIFCFAIAYSINSLVLSPIILLISNDVVYSDTVIPILLEYCGELSELCAISVCYAVIIASLYFFEENKVRKLLLVFGIATLYKYLANTVIVWFFNGSIPKLWIWDVVNVLFFTLLEFVQVLIVYLISKGIILQYKKRKRLYDMAGDCEDIKAYPFKSLYDKQNCFLRSIYVGAVVTFIAKLAGTLVSDIWSMLLYGLPDEPVTWILMLLNYGSKLLFGAIVYLISYIAVSKLLNKNLE